VLAEWKRRTARPRRAVSVGSGDVVVTNAPPTRLLAVVLTAAVAVLLTSATSAGTTVAPDPGPSAPAPDPPSPPPTFGTLPPGSALPTGDACAALVADVPEPVPANAVYNATTAPAWTATPAGARRAGASCRCGTTPSARRSRTSSRRPRSTSTPPTASGGPASRGTSGGCATPPPIRTTRTGPATRWAAPGGGTPAGGTTGSPNATSTAFEESWTDASPASEPSRRRSTDAPQPGHGARLRRPGNRRGAGPPGVRRAAAAHRLRGAGARPRRGRPGHAVPHRACRAGDPA